MDEPAFHIPEEDFNAILGEGDWTISEIPLKRAEQIRQHFGSDESFVVFGSGIAPLPDEMERKLPVAGIDWVRIETKPKPGETPLNVYHYQIRIKDGEKGFPVYYKGKTGPIAPHWSSLEDMYRYLDAMDEKRGIPPKAP